MEPRKEAICTALRRWIKQRPGLEFGNYGDVSVYRSEMRSITKDRHHAETLLAAVERQDSITADMLLAAARDAYSGRLSIRYSNEGGNELRALIDYCAGQYFPTEYRKAACAVLASALWYFVRDDIAETRKSDPEGAQYLKDAKTVGDATRRHFRREFGRSIAERWFR